MREDMDGRDMDWIAESYRQNGGMDRYRFVAFVNPHAGIPVLRYSRTMAVLWMRFRIGERG